MKFLGSVPFRNLMVAGVMWVCLINFHHSNQRFVKSLLLRSMTDVLKTFLFQWKHKFPPYSFLMKSGNHSWPDEAVAVLHGLADAQSWSKAFQALKIWQLQSRQYLPACLFKLHQNMIHTFTFEFSSSSWNLDISFLDLQYSDPLESFRFRHLKILQGLLTVTNLANHK